MLIGQITYKDFGEELEQFKAYFSITQTSRPTFLLLLLLSVYFNFTDNFLLQYKLSLC